MNSSFPRALRTSIKLAVVALAISLPLSAQAHRQWLLPSATVLSGKDAWVTVDAAVSNDLFYFEHFPLRLDGLAVTAPDGKFVQAVNAATGKYRSTFDVQLSQPGTYKIAVVNNGLFASYKVDGQQKRWRGSVQAFAREVPANAQELKVTQASSRIETFATSGKPTRGALAITGSGLELQPITNPTDLVLGDTAQFQLLLDGKPAAGIEVEVVPGGIRYRDSLHEAKLKTDAEGKFSVKWEAPGMHWVQASVSDQKSSLPQASQRRAVYAATLEVLPR
ncbi:DUF4198 domain-containing protein [Herbaspirillum sp. YR522]|uniref:DUF4198 domain-containing protein n=1 Tax=Herbaspirillum sp. YR522 TaxID=1144342 RepID=UPI00026FB378|nr:DUF4198 domain-containing protein [Herbaspirillum sp. YR522]EJN06167.1 ABC-type Co2+ transport system, periplasmic component [Herbaspirillum sp. YR522]